jgi:hypothetical protein
LMAFASPSMMAGILRRISSASMFTPSPYQKMHGLLHQVGHLPADVGP